jgi:hypothetical protein
MKVATGHSLMTHDVLVVMDLATRCVQIAGLIPQPMAAFMLPCARQLLAPY